MQMLSSSFLSQVTSTSTSPASIDLTAQTSITLHSKLSKCICFDSFCQLLRRPNEMHSKATSNLWADGEEKKNHFPDKQNRQGYKYIIYV